MLEFKLLPSIEPTFVAMVTKHKHKICHNSACIRCISKMLVSNRWFLESHGGIGLHFSMAVRRPWCYGNEFGKYYCLCVFCNRLAFDFL